MKINFSALLVSLFASTFLLSLPPLSLSVEAKTAAKKTKKKSTWKKKNTSKTKKSDDFPLAAIDKIKWPYSVNTQSYIAQGNWSAAWNEIKRTPPDKLLPTIAFVAGYVAYKNQKPLFAYKAFLRATLDPSLNDLAALWTARSAFRNDDFHTSAGWAARVPATSIYKNDADILLAKALLADNRVDDALRASKGIYAIGSPEARLIYADIQVRMANLVGLQKGENTLSKIDKDNLIRKHLLAAGVIYQEISQRYPSDQISEDANNKLLILLQSPYLTKGERASLDPDNYTNEALLARYNNFAASHNNDIVVKYLPDIIKGWPNKSPHTCDAKYLIAKSFTRLRKHFDSLPWYEDVIKNCDKEERRNALYMGGKAAWNAGDKDKAISLFDQLIKDYPKHSFADDALYFQARILLEMNHDKDARKILDNLVKNYPDGDMAKDAHWLILRSAFEGKRYMNIVRYIDALQSTGEDDIYSRGRTEYFKGVALFLANKPELAKASYKKVVDSEPMSYYALLAFNRYALLGAKSNWRPKPGENLCDRKVLKKLKNSELEDFCKSLPVLTAEPISVSAEVANELYFQQGLKLVQLNIESQAKAPFNALRKHLRKGTDGLWAFSYLLDLAGWYPLSHDIIRREIGHGWVNGYPLQADSNGLQRWALAFPRPFENDVKLWARRRGIQPAMIWAIMREESGFNSNIESWANAVGLMQLLPKTAEHVAKNEHFRHFQKSLLFQPDTAIRFGSGYLAELGNNGGGQPILMIAGYNGGWANVARWLKDANGLDIDLYVEDIPYGQTRNYTKRVLRSYWCYLMGLGGVYVPYIM